MKLLWSLWATDFAVIVVLVGIYVAIRRVLKKYSEAELRRWHPWILVALVVVFTLVSAKHSAKWKAMDAAGCVITIDSSTAPRGEEAALEINGDKSVLVLKIGADSSQLDILPASGEKQDWGILNSHVQNPFTETVDQSTVRIWRCAGIDDSYVEITSIASDGLEISDNRNSVFHTVEKDYLELGISTYIYYAYVGPLNDTYVLTIDGTDIQPGK